MIEDSAERRQPLRMRKQAARPHSKLDRHDLLLGRFAKRAAISIKADLDYGWRRRDYHDVSQWNG